MMICAQVECLRHEHREGRREAEAQEINGHEERALARISLLGGRGEEKTHRKRESYATEQARDSKGTTDEQQASRPGRRQGLRALPPTPMHSRPGCRCGNRSSGCSKAFRHGRQPMTKRAWPRADCKLSLLEPGGEEGEGRRGRGRDTQPEKVTGGCRQYVFLATLWRSAARFLRRPSPQRPSRPALPPPRCP